MRKVKYTLSLVLIYSFLINSAQAGIGFVKSNGITLTGADGITLTGADGITLTGADGITLMGADGITLTGADGAHNINPDGITLTGADGITLTGADGITLTGADGITLTGADGTTYRADSFIIRRPNGITLTGADGITLTGADGIVPVGTNGITLTGADGITLTGADGITLTGADGVVGLRANGDSFTVNNPTGITLTGADGITLTGADGITLTGVDGITLTGADSNPTTGNSGVQSLDPELAVALNRATDDSHLNAIIVFHSYPNQATLAQLQHIGIFGGTLYRALPMAVVTATRAQLIAVSQLPQVRSLYGNRTLSLNADPFFKPTGIQRVAADRDLQSNNSGMPVSGRNVTVAVLDTGVNALHSDLAGKVVQNVRLADTQSAGVGFLNPLPVENLLNTDLAGGHGTFVAGVIAGSGVQSGGKYNGVAPGANILGLSAGDMNLTYVLAGFDYLLAHGAKYNVRVVNCSFSASTLYDTNDPVNIASQMLTQRGVSVVFSAGNTGAGNNTLNPYAVAPWVVSVGATNEKNRLASFSSRGSFGNALFRPSVVAPGVNVVSLRNIGTETGTLGTVTAADTQRLTPAELPFYTTASGTSFTAPQVAGAIALMLEANPQLRPEQVKDILQRSATPLPAYYPHEVGAGMLNTHAAVLEAAFPQRRSGIFRAAINRQPVQFTTSVLQIFGGTTNPAAPAATSISLPANTLQASISIAWGDMFSLNDLGLKVMDNGGALYGESNLLNLPGLTGKRESVVINNPSAQALRAEVQDSLGIGTAQRYVGAVEITRVAYPALRDTGSLSVANQAAIYASLRAFLMETAGNKFHPAAAVTRGNLANAMLRAGRAPQYLAAGPLYTDVRDLTTRGAVESAQMSPDGSLFYDAPVGGLFRPDAAATKLAAAVAFVKAAGLSGQANGAFLPLTVTDANQIPANLRGYVAVALQNGLIGLDGNAFNPNRSLTRLEMATALIKIVNSY